MERRLTAILAADVVGYSRLMSLDEAGTLAALKAHRRELTDAKIAEHHGRIVKLTGDGLLAEFPSVVNAVACATEIQRRMRERNVDVAEGRRIEFRIGINLGDVIFEDNDIFGDGVNVAARIEALAKPGGVALSGTVHDHIGNRLELDFEDAGEQHLKNIDRPVRVYHVVLGRSPSTAPSAASTKTETRSREKPSIAVLPFNNMSGDPEQEYFSDGITEDIITDLSKISGLFVVGRNTVFTYKGKPVKLQQMAAELGVRYLLEGSVRKAGQRVRITGQLIDGKDGGHIWAERYDRDLTDIFAVQDEITHAIVDQLKIKLLPEEEKAISQPATANVEAYNYYLRGRDFFRRTTKSYYTLAKRMFLRALELDPLYARAYAGIADCDALLYLNYDEKVSIDEILANSNKALELESGLAEAHASRGLALSLTQRYEEAEREFDKAVASDPDSFEVRRIAGRVFFVQGKFEEAEQHFKRAALIKPEEYVSFFMLSQIYNTQGRREDELEAARRGVYAAERELIKNPDNPRPASLGASALAQLGEVERAKEWAARAIAIDPHDSLTQYNIACFYSTIGENDKALDLLEKLLPTVNATIKAWARQDSDFTPLHGHPRWQTILKLIE
jgi:adenylate cyclase